MLGFFNPPPQRVIGQPDHAAVFIVYFYQPAFGVVRKPLHTALGAAFFDHPAKCVVAVTLVLIGQQFVVHHQPGAGLWAVEQVGGCVVSAGDRYCCQITRIIRSGPFLLYSTVERMQEKYSAGLFFTVHHRIGEVFVSVIHALQELGCP